jgi:hypothetical protein
MKQKEVYSMTGISDLKKIVFLKINFSFNSVPVV